MQHLQADIARKAAHRVKMYAVRLRTAHIDRALTTQDRADLDELRAALDAVTPRYGNRGASSLDEYVEVLDEADMALAEAQAAWAADRRRRMHRDWSRAKRPSRAKPVEPTTCATCGETFTPKRRDARFCSPRCRVAAHRRRGFCQPRC